MPAATSSRKLAPELYHLAMKVFISWSGRRSHEVAEVLGPWLRKVIQSAEPWISSEMERGVKWLAELGSNLDSHSIGILCVTPGNKDKPWINFEAGALSKHLGDEGRVIPYLLDFKSPSDLKEPLGQFNASLADRDGTWEIVKTLNAHAEYSQSETSLTETFEMWWPKLEERLSEISASVTQQPPSRRTSDDKIDEILELTRQLLRRGGLSDNSDLESALGIRNATAHGRIVGQTKPSLESLVRGFRGEGTLSVGGVTNRPSIEEIADDVVGMMLLQAGLDLSAMKVIGANEAAIEVFVPHSIHVSVLQKVREALRTTTGTEDIYFVTRRNEMEMERVDLDNPGEP
jgi:hypothetical protein